ncbi:MAG: MFS transporter [Deltaproteobacteria bacterium]|nr:MFS transporter [Deltaproteobacteria bacterium]
MTSHASVWDAAHWRLTTGLVLTVSMTAFEALAVATALPAVVRDLGGLHLYGWAFSGFMLANLLGISAAGGAADRRGVRLPFVAGSLLFIGGLLGAGAASTMLAVVLSRVAQGLGAGALSAIAYVVIARGYAPAARPHMMALLSSAWVMPGLVGPAIAGTIADHWHWRWVFLALAPLTAVAAALVVPGLRQLPPAETAAADNSTPAALLLAASAGVVLSAPQIGARSIALGCAAGGSLLALAALRRLLPAGTLVARPGLPATIATIGLLSAAFFGAEAFLPLTLNTLRGQSTLFAGLALTAATLTWTAGAWLPTRLAGRYDRRSLIIAGLSIMFAGLAGLVAVLDPAVPVAAAIVTWGVAGFGIGIAYSTTAVVVLEAAPRGGEGAASAALQLANVLGAAVGTGVGGALVALATEAQRSTADAILAVDLVVLLIAALSIVAARRIVPP